MELLSRMHLIGNFKPTIMKKQVLMLIALMVLSFGFIAPEDRTLTGKVTAAADNRPLFGVNVSLRGTSVGTVTDSQGKKTER